MIITLGETMGHKRLAIIADDFTGALDTGVQFAKKGLEIEVISNNLERIKDIDDRIKVIVFDTESRHLDPDIAYERVFNAVSACIASGCSYIYKKTDSALRGNIGSELEAVLDASKISALHFFPALPKIGRTTKDGIQFISGIPVSESHFRNDPINPVRHSKVMDIIAETSSVKVTNGHSDTGICVYDSSTDEEMKRIGESLSEDELRLTAGNSGFAEYLSSFIALEGRKSSYILEGKNLMIISASLNRITLSQLEKASKEGYPRRILQGEEKVKDDFFLSGRGDEIIFSALEKCHEHGGAIIDCGDAESDTKTLDYARKMGIEADSLYRHISRNFGFLVKRLLDLDSSLNLLIIGGDTLSSALSALGIESITVVDELLQGVVLNRINYRNKAISLMSKSGGFGPEDLVRKLDEIVTKQSKGDKMMRPIIGITLGDPFGTGPEITIKALSDKSIYELSRPLVVGDSAALEYAIKVQKVEMKLNRISCVSDAIFKHGTIDILDMNLISKSDFPQITSPPKPLGLGPNAKGGEAAFRYVEKVIELAMDKKIDATVTNAISKEAINMAGHHFSGHTEIYAHYTKTPKYTMMLTLNELRVVHVSTHVSLREACDRVKKDRVLDVIRIANMGSKQIGITHPRIAVAGLNPHCGENGMFGREEIEEIQPAIDEAIKEGIIIPDGKPTPPDTVFSKALGGWYDIVVAMYHDQGHIPLKVKGFVYNKSEGHWDAVAGVNITLGIPIIRTSVDHGTGFDISGEGRCSEISLLNAIDLAIKMAKNR